MSFFDLLQTVGGRLGILEAPATTDSGEPGKVATRTVTLNELKSEIHSAEVRALAELPAELSFTFDKIFEAAGIRPPDRNWTVQRLQTELLGESYRKRDRAAAQQVLLAALQADGVAAEDLIRQAVAQDQALDAFEAFVCRKVEEQMAMAQHAIAELESKVQELQNERARQTRQMQLEREKLIDWRKRKRAFERELAVAVGYLTDRPVISTDDGPSADS